MQTPKKQLTRRDFIRLATIGAGASALYACSSVSSAAESTATPTGTPTASPTSTPAPTATPAAPARELAVRFAHISDMHIEPKSTGLEHFARALRGIQLLDPPVEFVINAGDCVMDTLTTGKPRAEEQWDAFQSILKPDYPLPVYHAIGNHDVWGWGLPPNQQERLQSDPMFAKGMAMDRLGLSSRYYSFDRGGWHFIVLDSTHIADVAFDQPYTGKLDEEQYNWLVQDLEKTDSSTSVCVVSHIPILSACTFLDGDNEASGNWNVPGAWMHIDARRLWSLFWEHPNVKLALSGHTHQVEDLMYHGVRYQTNGAICGNWWNGPYFDFPYGYFVFNLYKDGSSESEFIAY